MTSSQPVTTPNALNFTPDNKRAYAYSGSYTATNAWKNLLTFTTQSEYLSGIVSLQGLINYAGSTPADGYTSNWRITFNDVIVIKKKTKPQKEHPPATIDYPLIIPPFTDVSIDRFDEGDAATREGGCSFVCEAFGMTDTGYQ